MKYTTWYWSFQFNKPVETEDKDIGQRLRDAGRGFDSDEACDIAHYNDCLNEKARKHRALEAPILRELDMRRLKKVEDEKEKHQKRIESQNKTTT